MKNWSVPSWLVRDQVSNVTQLELTACQIALQGCNMDGITGTVYWCRSWGVLNVRCERFVSRDNLQVAVAI